MDYYTVSSFEYDMVQGREDECWSEAKTGHKGNLKDCD